MVPVIKELDGNRNFKTIIIHTGQHFDYNMDKIFYEDLQLREPDFHFVIKDLPPNYQISVILKKGTKVIEKNEIDFVLVHGDTNTTIAGSILANKMNIPVGHVEAGLRSFDKTMPEEVNRTVADHLSTELFAPTEIAKINLNKEGIFDNIHVVGNTVVDALLQNIKIAEKKSKILNVLDVDKNYFLITFHRTENVDNKEKLENFVHAVEKLSKKFEKPIIFPVHPRTKKKLTALGLQKKLEILPTLKLIEPIGYLDFLVLLKNSSVVLTDSGGIQEESCILKVPCVTLRENTERPETVEVGANMLAGTNPHKIAKCVSKMLNTNKNWKNPLGNGNSSKKIREILLKSDDLKNQ
jgi:UDP-N-acetylglucosamine 2-epimerase (non-hydrolysing)